MARNFANGDDDPALHQTSWPLPIEDLEHTLRYGTPTQSELLAAASVLAAYGALIAHGTTAEQGRRLRALRRVWRRRQKP